MSDAHDGSRVRTHVGLGIVYGALAGLVQGLTDACILAIRYDGFILRPQDIFKSHFFGFVGRILHFDSNEPVQFVIDSYLGPGFGHKLPLFLNLTAVYVIFGLLGGAALGVLVWITFKLAKRSMDIRSLSIVYLSLVVSFGVFVNLAIWFDGKDLFRTLSVLGLAVTLVLILCASLFSGFLYRWLRAVLKNSLASRMDITSGSLIGAVKTVLVSVGLIMAGAAILNLFILKEKKPGSETFAAQVSKDVMNGMTKGEDVNVILISVDSLRADHVSCYGYHRKTSPNIDRLAGEGVLFFNAFSNTSWTLPAHTSMLTSMYSKSHGVVTDDNRLDENRTTLAEMLKKAGYSTAAFVSGPYLNSVYGMAQGFDLYDDRTIDFDNHLESHHGVTSPRLNESIESWLRDNYKKKFFLFLHYWDVHYDYGPPPPYDTMFDPNYEGTTDFSNYERNPRIEQNMSSRDLFHIIALYDGEIALTDKYIGRLFSTLKELRVYDRTIIILTADHGDEFFEHGEKGHRKSLYDEVLRVPLIFKFPNESGLPDGITIQEIVSIVDIVPTVLDYIGVISNEEMQGRNLLPLIKNGIEPAKSLVYSRLERSLVAVRSPNLKLIRHLRAPRKELYNLVKDPGEKNNLIDEDLRRNGTVPGSNKLQISLLDWLNTQHQIYRAVDETDAENEVELTEPMKKQLESLGYIQ